MKEKIKSLLSPATVTMGLVVLLLFLVGFGAGNHESAMFFYWAAGICGAFLILMFEVGKLDHKNLSKNTLWYFIPLGIFILLICFNNFLISWGTTYLFYGIFAIAGFVGFFLIGFVLRNNPSIKPHYLLYGLVAGLGLLVFVNFIANLVSYPPFYVATASNSIYFWNGVPHTIGNEARYLYGFYLSEVTVEYAAAPAVILASSAGALFFYKKDRLPEIIFMAVFAAIGWLYLIFLPFVYGIVIAAIIVAVCALYRILRPKEEAPKGMKIAAIAVLAVMGVALLIVFVNAIFEPSFIANNRLLNKIFNNGRLQPINQTISVIFHGGTSSFSGGNAFLAILFGAKAAWYGYFNVLSPVRAYYIDNFSFEFETLLEGGLIAFVALCIFLVMAIRTVRAYILRNHDFEPGKIGIAAILASIFVYYSFFYEQTPFAVSNHVGYPVSFFYPSMNSFMALAAMLLLGYTFVDLHPKKVEEEVEQPEAVKEPEEASEEVAA